MQAYTYIERHTDICIYIHMYVYLYISIQIYEAPINIFTSSRVNEDEITLHCLFESVLCVSVASDYSQRHTLQTTATHCNPLHNTATSGNTLQHIETFCHITATHCVLKSACCVHAWRYKTFTLSCI